jgi:hypothetical protein
MLEAVFGWPALGVVVALLIGAGFAVLSMAPPRHRIAEACFSVAAVIFWAKFTYWAVTSDASPRERALVSLAVFGVSGALLIWGLSWIEGMIAKPIAIPTEKKPDHANVHIVGFGFLEIKEGAPLTLAIDFENNGKLSAFRFRYSVGVFIDTDQSEDFLQSVFETLRRGVSKDLAFGASEIQPGHKESFRIGLPAVLSKEDYESLVTLKKHLYFMVLMRYADANGTGETALCGYLNASNPPTTQRCTDNNYERHSP